MHTVMIVEDEPIIRDAVAQELSKWNYQVECVTDFNQFCKSKSSVSDFRYYSSIF